MTTPVQTPNDVAMAAVTKLLKPGSRTSEFLSLIVVWGATLATLLGAFSTHNPTANAVLKVAALIAAAASQVGYALSRGDVKAALGTVTSAMVDAGVAVPVTRKAAATPPSDAGAVDLVGLVAGVLTIAGLIWLVIGFTHHVLDVFGLVLLLVGAGVYLLFGGRATFRRRP